MGDGQEKLSDAAGLRVGAQGRVGLQSDAVVAPIEVSGGNDERGTNQNRRNARKPPSPPLHHGRRRRPKRERPYGNRSSG